MWVFPARTPATNAGISRRFSQDSMTVSTRGRFGRRAVIESRSERCSGASGRRSGTGVGDTPHTHGPSLMGQNATSLVSPQHEVSMTTRWHPVSSQECPAESPCRPTDPKPGSPAKRSDRMTTRRLMVKSVPRLRLRVQTAHSPGVFFWVLESPGIRLNGLRLSHRYMFTDFVSPRVGPAIERTTSPRSRRSEYRTVATVSQQRPEQATSNPSVRHVEALVHRRDHACNPACGH